MFSLVYKSQTTKDFSAKAIEQMLLKAQKTNKRENITGCLLFHNGWFIQLLEGDETKVKKLFKAIKGDKRHTAVSVLSMEESVVRMFTNWHMIYSKISENPADQDQNKKRELFDNIFHSSGAVSTPGNSKLALWIQVNKLLSKDSNQSTLSLSNKLPS